MTNSHEQHQLVENKAKTAPYLSNLVVNHS